MNWALYFGYALIMFVTFLLCSLLAAAGITWIDNYIEDKKEDENGRRNKN